MIDLTDPIATLLLVVRALRDGGIPSAVYGGLALAAYGEPRETKDADLAVVGVTAAQGEDALRKAGLDVLVPFDHVPFGGNFVSRFTLLGGAGVTGLNTADLVEPRSPRYARAALARAIDGSLRGEPVRVVSPEDFVLFKVLSTRERDVEDAATIVRALGPALDWAGVEREAALLATEIPDHEVLARLARVATSARSHER
jgi:hypothetical protein